MAKSPSHTFGQIIGDVLEAAVGLRLSEFAKAHGLYLDKKGPRPCRSGRKVTWTDLNGNKHDLDFVLERGGTPRKQGAPVAFIESAWRRYTKHSKNKVQEIQGAIEPLAETHRKSRPFKGAILAGDFTEPALTQLTSLGFTVLYIPYARIVSVFKKVGVDASYGEDTSHAPLKAKVNAYKKLSPEDRERLVAEMPVASSTEAGEFFVSLEAAINRLITRILVLPLHGEPRTVASVEDAIEFIEHYNDGDPATPRPIARYEIQIQYDNAEKIDASFVDKSGALNFLREYI